MNRPLASLSLDLDNEWSYLKTRGDPAWSSYPSYLDIVVPRVLEFLDRRGLRITFFIVGQDAALESNARALRAISSAGHEIGNHSFHHEPWLHLYSDPALEREVALAEDAIAGATGVRPTAFRGPGFSFSPALLSLLSRRGYQVDASTFPTFIGPVARAYYFLRSGLRGKELQRRRRLFGTLADGLRPNKPYLWRCGADSIVEIPVTTMPGLRLPIHVSYLLYLAGWSHRLAVAYFRSALAACRLSGTNPSLLLHPLDFLGCEDVTSLSFFPGMHLPLRRKLDLVADVIDALMDDFEVVTIGSHASLVSRHLRELPLLPARS
jgi:hypothetical protein